MSAELPRSRDRLRDCPVDFVAAEVKRLPGRTRVEMEMCGLPKNDIRPIMPGLNSGGAHPAPVCFRSGGGFRGADRKESWRKTHVGPVNAPHRADSRACDEARNGPDALQFSRAAQGRRTG